MKQKIFKTLWGFNGPIELAITQALDAGMHGIEGMAPQLESARHHLSDLLLQNDLAYIAEITTAGAYVPERRATPQDHLDSLHLKLQHSVDLNPVFVSCLAGCDAWPEKQSVEFFKRAIELAHNFDVPISFETHRSRSLFNPWTTQRIVEQVPDLLLTVDFSHWCVVCERLIDTELDVIHAIADNVQHIHARIGYDQGPQVPDPRAPEYQAALQSHQAWWEIIWQSQLNRHFAISTITPEFGPDGYLHEAPYTREPVADLWELNCWMATVEKQHFTHFMQRHATAQ